MGFNWMDVANVAVGAIDRDRQITKEDLAIRADELKAERDSLIRRKDAKYDYELKKFYQEKEKADEINSLNAEAAAFNKSNEGTNITFDQDEYADRYLMIKMGVEKYNALSDDRKKALRSQFGNTNRKYAFDSNYLTNYENELDKEKKFILKDYANQLSEAKGDSFLINTILSKTPWKKKEKITTEDKINSDEKVETIVESLESTDTKDITKITDTKDSTDEKILLSKKVTVNTPDKEYNSRWEKMQDESVFKLNNDNDTLKFINTMNISGAGNELSFKFNKTDSKIEGMQPNAQVNLIAIEAMFNGVRDSKDNATYAYNNISKEPTDIKKYFSQDAIWTATSKAINNGRANTETNSISGKGTNKYILTTIVPLSVVDIDGGLQLGDAKYQVDDKSKMKSISVAMSKFIDTEARKIDSKFLDGQGKVNKIYTALIDGDAKVVNDFKNYLYANDNNVKKFYDENKSTTEGKTKTTSSAVDSMPPPERYQMEKDISDNKIRTVVVNIDGEKKEVPLTEKNKEILDANKIDYSVTEDVTTGDAAIAEQMGSMLRKDDTGKTIKITPKEVGFNNKPVFESIEEILSILPNDMTGAEIKEKYEIAFPLNNKTVYRSTKLKTK